MRTVEEGHCPRFYPSSYIPRKFIVDVVPVTYPRLAFTCVRQVACSDILTVGRLMLHERYKICTMALPILVAARYHNGYLEFVFVLDFLSIHKPGTVPRLWLIFGLSRQRLLELIEISRNSQTRLPAIFSKSSGEPYDRGHKRPVYDLAET